MLTCRTCSPARERDLGSALGDSDEQVCSLAGRVPLGAKVASKGSTGLGSAGNTTQIMKK